MEKIRMLEVSSSNVKSVGFDEKSNTLYVNFLNGEKYCYSGVPKKEFQNLVSATSVGRYLHAYIKGKYPYKKI